MGVSDRVLPLILISTEDLELYLLLDHILRIEDLTSRLVAPGEEMRKSLRERRPAVLLVECRGAAESFRNLCLALRQDETAAGIPIIALVAQQAEWEFVSAIGPETAEIFVRPIWPAKLIHAIRAALEPRSSAERGQDRGHKLIAYADLRMDVATYHVWRGERELHLSPIEFKLLRYLLERPEEVVTRHELRIAAWQPNIHVGPRTVDVHVGRLRRALGAGGESNLIRTIRSVGYALSAAAEMETAPPGPRDGNPRRRP